MTTQQFHGYIYVKMEYTSEYSKTYTTSRSIGYICIGMQCQQESVSFAYIIIKTIYQLNTDIYSDYTRNKSTFYWEMYISQTKAVRDLHTTTLRPEL